LVRELGGGERGGNERNFNGGEARGEEIF